MKTQPFYSLLRSLLICALFSLPIAYMTHAIWGGHYSMHYRIAMSYSVVGTFSSMFVRARFPKLSHLWSFTLSATLTLSIGSLQVWYWINPYYSNIDWPLMLKIILISLVFISVVYYYFFSREQNLAMLSALQQAELDKIRAEQALTLSQLKLLQSQIEPHFLFNTLANLKALIALDPEQAQRLLDTLTELLRITLKKSRQASISVADELTGIRAYLSIQQIRLGERLSFAIELTDGDLSQAQLPPMLLQPLVENAVFHGIEPKPEGGEVRVKIAMLQQRWQIQVCDNGLGIDNKQRQGNGLALNNIRQRLVSLYPENQASLSLSAQTGGGTVATLEFPCEA
ncbi:sensor histidine kinase [Agarivorans sp. QJM3NY_25]|uniref:sensor histidine kinase n=1 Tax=Agarivorans sp. QJM3NY_25 TaxID=3421430 RepID=UPI003D7D00B1